MIERGPQHKDTGIWLAHVDSRGEKSYQSYHDTRENLVAGALHSWVGDPSMMRIHMGDEIAGAGPPMGGTGKIARAQAKALLTEVRYHGRTNPRMLYRGERSESLDPVIPSTWSEKPHIGRQFARDYGGQVSKAPKGTVKGVRMADHVRSGLDEREQQWLVIKP